ncbi:hypothetical protein ZIOFF_039917 [Zingiber officinale]|uniref:Uncharacterized protein n=1 Tax=Zingiber officinale TaxID=94328 RepID=A0A8J5G338_ZINOF|nr:hypothetical protein ZIOFF_039917 [Zingiber officinale]
MEWKWLGKLGWAAVLGLVCLLVSLAVVSLERSIRIEGLRGTKRTVQEEDIESNYIANSLLFLWQTDKNSYKPVWPPMEFGWKIAVGSMIGFFGAAFGSVGGVGRGGIFMPMLALIVGFDPKSTTAISKCKKIYPPNSWISIGVIFNVVFPDWMVTVLLINNLGTSTKAFMKGVDTWKLETILKREAAKRLVPSGVPLLQNIYWKELGMLVFVWMSFLALQIAKNSTATCSHMVLDIKLLTVGRILAVRLYYCDAGIVIIEVLSSNFP